MQLPQFNTQNRNSPIDILEPNNGTQSLNWSQFFRFWACLLARSMEK
jgi:hypothetical protein